MICRNKGYPIYRCNIMLSLYEYDIAYFIFNTSASAGIFALYCYGNSAISAEAATSDLLLCMRRDCGNCGYSCDGLPCAQGVCGTNFNGFVSLDLKSASLVTSTVSCALSAISYHAWCCKQIVDPYACKVKTIHTNKAMLSLALFHNLTSMLT